MCESHLRDQMMLCIFQELTEVDTLNEADDAADGLIDALLEGQVTALLIQNMERLDETVKEEADGVYNSLGKFTKYEKQILRILNMKWLGNQYHC